MIRFYGDDYGELQGPCHGKFTKGKLYESKGINSKTYYLEHIVIDDDGIEQNVPECYFWDELPKMDKYFQRFEDAQDMIDSWTIAKRPNLGEVPYCEASRILGGFEPAKVSLKPLRKVVKELISILSICKVHTRTDGIRLTRDHIVEKQEIHYFGREATEYSMKEIEKWLHAATQEYNKLKNILELRNECEKEMYGREKSSEKDK